MSWHAADGELERRIRERQRITIEHYSRDPDLLAEHVGMEDNFEGGGYGERQVQELLQNAVDQLDVPGRVEFRIADGVLYCANEGRPFSDDGIKAVAGAFLSSKSDDKIGRFGLGFKSVLGVSDRPQILSRSVSFGFNEPEATALLSNLDYRPSRVPTLRVPSLVDPVSLAHVDPNVASLMEWATTIVRLPLIRGGDRIRRELDKFDAKYLLFAPNLTRVDVSLADIDGSIETRTYRRVFDSDSNLVQLEEPGGKLQRWRLLERRHQVSDGVAKGLPALFRRNQVTVSYALQQGPGGSAVGRFWAWFPLQDETTASGIFNAPWQVNDDRTSMLPGSELNQELLEVAAELVLTAARLESSDTDPARHLDILPARGREVRSAADRYMSERLPQLARRIPLVPTAAGDWAVANQIVAPAVSGQVNAFALPPDMVRIWTALNPVGSMPHWTCYSTPTRAARLRGLLVNDEGEAACGVLPLAKWVEQLVGLGGPKAVAAALHIVAGAKGDKVLWDEMAKARVIPLADGDYAAARDASSVVFALEVDIPLSQARVVDSGLGAITGVNESLRAIGVRDPSPDVVAVAAASRASSNWNDEHWRQLWLVLATASTPGAAEAINAITERRVEMRLPTIVGRWRPAREVCVDASRVPGLPDRAIDLQAIRGRRDLAVLAGAVDEVTGDYPVGLEESWAIYTDAMQKHAEKAVRDEYGERSRGELQFEPYNGAGPLDILRELDASANPATEGVIAQWTFDIIQWVDEPKLAAQIRVNANKYVSASFERPEVWAAKKYGLVGSSLGLRRARAVVSHDLTEFGDLIPVATSPDWQVLGLPTRLGDVPTHVLQSFLERSGYQVRSLESFHALLGEAACRAELADVARIPALSAGSDLVELVDRRRAITASQSELDDLGHLDVRYVPEGQLTQTLRDVWGLASAVDVISRAVDWIPAGEPQSLKFLYPTLERIVDDLPLGYSIRACHEIVRRVSSPTGQVATPLSFHLEGHEVLVDSALDEHQVLQCVSNALTLELTPNEISQVIEADEKFRYNDHIQRVLAEPGLWQKLLALVGRERLASKLPDGLLALVEQRQGDLSDKQVSILFLSTYGNDALRELKEAMEAMGLNPPRTWDGSAEAANFVLRIGFPRVYAGSRELRAATSELIPGKVELKELHDFQRDLSGKIEQLLTTQTENGGSRRGLLYLPTGAGKTRVTTQSIAELMRDDRLASPVLWVAQSAELCEQAILSWTEVWRAIGDERPLEISRYWANHEVDESLQELQVVVATDDKLKSMIGDPHNRTAHEWLRSCSVAVIDEAHRAGSPTYTEILRWLGITAGAGAKTERPLLGLTATPFRGRNAVVNQQFVARFGNNLLNALDVDDPIGQLREMEVLSRVEHQVLEGVAVPDSPRDGATGSKAWDDVSREILKNLGANLDRTEMLVDHIFQQDPSWPILVFTPSVVSAHVTAALLRNRGRTAEAVDGSMRPQQRRRKIEDFRDGKTQVLVNCDLLTQGFDAPQVRALYIARPTFSPNRYIQMVGRGLRGPRNGGTRDCLVVNVADTFSQFDKELAYTEFDHLWETRSES
ncbi:helicase-related protein [Demequina sp.]|uniref:DEAD/DEAH box helicase n=1 Tax=Demequina sp. TaxID=2050685 RepID=UPI0025BCE340|nr:helicase-related protein [Demequina sp.]